MRSPYADASSKAFWKSAVSNVDCGLCDELYNCKFSLSQHESIVTAGSCFAQHITEALRIRGYKILDQEIPPPSFPKHLYKKYNYSVYSARYGNIYTARQLLELAQEAFSEIPVRQLVWESSGGFVDALRPSIEPDGFHSINELMANRELHLSNVRKCFLEMDVFIFTFGLTEAWLNCRTGYTLPVAPGVIAGDIRSDPASFVNFSYEQTLQSMLDFISLLKKYRSSIPKIILTVSPVPLTATATKNHVLVANSHSKSILRSVAAALVDKFKNIDYFPSYEIITHPKRHSLYYSHNDRSITRYGVDAVMNCFFSEHSNSLQVKSSLCERDVNVSMSKGEISNESLAIAAESLICEEDYLEVNHRSLS